MPARSAAVDKPDFRGNASAFLSPAQSMNPNPPSRPVDRLEGLSEQGRHLFREATSALQRHHVGDTLRHLAALHALAPGHPETLRLRSAVARLQGRVDDAIGLLREAVAARPADTLARTNLAHLLAGNGAVDAATQELRRCCELEPTQAAHRLALAQMLEHGGDAEGARSTLDEVLRHLPDHAPARLALARVLQTLGLGDAAAAEYRRVLALAPDAVPAWYGLSTLQRYPLDADDLAAIERLHARTDLTDSARASIGFALARARESSGQHAEAWDALASANAGWRKRLQWDSGRFTRHVRAVEAAFSRPPSAAANIARGAGLVFIVGLPRSGSSIAEQILATHPDVAAGGELEYVTTIIRGESERREQDFPGWVATASDEDWARLGDAYLARIEARRNARHVFTDKSLMNWLYLGALRAMLPAARFIDCRRDPLENCIACYRQMFAKELGFTYDLDELVAFWRDHDHAMRHWRSLHADRILELAHERLVAEPEAGIRRLLDFCGLRFDERCLRFHEFERAVRTLSADQVREPLRSNTARADLYGTKVDPLRALIARATASA